MEKKQEGQSFKEGLKFDISSQQKQLEKYIFDSVQNHSNIMQDKEFCENFIAALALEIKRMFSDLNIKLKFRYKSPDSSFKKLQETIYVEDKDGNIDMSFSSDPSGNLTFSKGLYDTCAVRLILMNVPSFESLQNNIYLTANQKKSLRESFKMYNEYRKIYYQLQQREKQLIYTRSEKEYYNLHIAVYDKIADIEEALRKKLNLDVQMTGDEEKYRSKSRILQIDLEDEQVLTEVSDKQIESLKRDMNLLERKLADSTEQDILDIIFPAVLNNSELLSEKFGAKISDNPIRTKLKAKKNGYISKFDGLDIPYFDETMKIECQNQSLYRYIRHKETHSEMAGKSMKLPEIPETPSETDKHYKRKIKKYERSLKQYKEYIDNVLFEGYDLEFNAERPDEVVVRSHSKDEDLESLYIAHKDIDNDIIMREFRDKIEKLKELGILGESVESVNIFSIKSINNYLNEIQNNQDKDLSL